MGKTFKLVDKKTDEIIMYGTSERVCRIFATKYEHTKACLDKDEKRVHLLSKPNAVKQFYKAHLDEDYRIEEIEEVKVYNLNEVNCMNFFTMFNKYFFKKS